MIGIALLVAVTVLYAGYNLFIKLSGQYVPPAATTTVLATLVLQLAALTTTITFLAVLSVRGNDVMTLSRASYLWAIVAGLCIGAAEIGYFYLFTGIGLERPFAASVAIPSIVCGTVIITMIFSAFALREPMGWNTIAGSALILTGVVLLFYKRRI